MNHKIGVLNPGLMGSSVAASVKNGGNPVYWASAGRSEQTHERAGKIGLLDAGSLPALCETCTAIISVCPPHAAEEVAAQVLGQGFKGLYLDVNAISPQKSVRIGERLSAAGVNYVDGGIVGPPAWKPGTTCLYLCGSQADAVAELFSAGPMQPVVIGDSIGKASALKMCYAAYTKGTTALLSAILGAASQLGVQQELEKQWSREDPAFAERTKDRVRVNTAKAWRFVGEMEEIAATFREAGLPGEFHLAAADVFGRLSGFKDAPETPSIEEVLAALVHKQF